MHHANIHATRQHTTAADEHHAAEGFAVWIALYVALMIAAMAFFAGANLLGDRFDRSALPGWADVR